MKQKHFLKKDRNKRDMQCERWKGKNNTANQPTEVHTIPTINDTARQQLLEREKQEAEECKVDIMMMMILVRVVGVAAATFFVVGNMLLETRRAASLGFSDFLLKMFAVLKAWD